MKSVYLKLSSIDDVYTLVNVLVAYAGDVDLESGRYMVDGKSLLGIFSLDLRRPVKATFHNAAEAETILAKLAHMVVPDDEA